MTVCFCIRADHDCEKCRSLQTITDNRTYETNVYVAKPIDNRTGGWNETDK